MRRGFPKTMGCVCEKIDQDTKIKMVRPKVNNSQNLQTLTAAQKSLIRNNWQVLKCHVSSIGVITYVRYAILIVILLSVNLHVLNLTIQRLIEYSISLKSN